jgi:hypothetical protein
MLSRYAGFWVADGLAVADAALLGGLGLAVMFRLGAGLGALAVPSGIAFAVAWVPLGEPAEDAEAPPVSADPLEIRS